MTNTINLPSFKEIENLAKERSDVYINSRFVGNAWINEEHQPYVNSFQGLMHFDLISDEDNYFAQYWGYLPQDLDKDETDKIEASFFYGILTFGFGFGESVTKGKPIELISPFGSDIDKTLGIKTVNKFLCLKGFFLWFENFVNKLKLKINGLKQKIKQFELNKKEIIKANDPNALIRINEVLENIRSSDIYNFYKVYKKDIDQLLKF